MKNRYSKMSNPELYKYCKERGGCSLESRRQFAAALPEVLRRKLHRRRGFGSIHEFAAKLAGMSKESVNKVLNLSRKLEDKPMLKKQLEGGKVGWSKIEKVAYVATAETDGEWAKRVSEMPQSALSLYVKEMRSKPEELTLESEIIPEEVLILLKQIKGKKTWEEVAKQLQTLLPEEPEAVETESRHIPMRIQRYVREKHNHLCAYPGCQKEPTSLHHTQRWALEKVHDPKRIVPLCTGHERLAHLGYIENEDQETQRWKLREEAHPYSGAKSFIDELVALKRAG